MISDSAFAAAATCALQCRRTSVYSLRVEEVHEEEDKAAKLEALLEQFREPEEPRKKGNPIWLALALLFSVGACWLAMKATEGTILLGQAAAAPKETKTAKSTERAARKIGPQFSTEAYVERSRKGMTARQLRWIVEDFQSAGLDNPQVDKAWQLVSTFRETAEHEKGPGWLGPDISRVAKGEALELGWRQRAWYLDLLADGLSLDVWQKRQARERCSVRLLETEVNFLKDPASDEEEEDVQAQVPVQVPVQYHPIGDLPSYASLAEPTEWLEDQELAPWKLVDLAEPQLRITWHAFRQPERLGGGEEPPWFDPAAMQVLNLAIPGRPPAVEFPEGTYPKEIEGAAAIFPFITGQDFSPHRKGTAGPLESEAMGCHPAQLKTLLLLRPELASELMEELEESGE